VRVFILALILIFFLFLQPNERMNDEVSPLIIALKHSSMPCLKLLVQVCCLLHSDWYRISVTDAGSSYVIKSVSHWFMEKAYDCFVLIYVCRLELM
jgi:hypothetical protein